MTDFQVFRDRMVEEQLIARGINGKKVLDAFRRVERHEFVPVSMRDAAYADHPLPIGEGQTISQPYIAALMTQSLDLKGDEKILEIGAGSGYQAAILSGLAKEVYSVERISALAERAEANLKKTGCGNVKVVVGDGTSGLPEKAPYDGIIVTAAAPEIPEDYIRQLKTGGRLVIPVGGMFGQVMTVVKKTEKGVFNEELCGCVFVPLVGKKGWKE